MVLKAYAKINLTLDIAGKRQDGYHLIDSVFQSVGAADTVTVEKAGKTSVKCGALSGEGNIAFKAAESFFKYTGISGGAEINIEKNIPVCAGLGGGSADAAAVIVALDKLYGVSLPKAVLAEIGLECGADVPFAVYGGTARVGGIGEKVEPLPALEGYYALLLKEGEKQSTADMYKRLDGMPPRENKTEPFLRLLSEKGGEAALKTADNVFGALCEDKTLVDVLKSQNPICVSVSGSGPVHFAVFGSEAGAKAAEAELEAKGFKPLAAPFINCGIKIIE